MPHTTFLLPCPKKKNGRSEIQISRFRCSLKSRKLIVERSKSLVVTIDYPFVLQKKRLVLDFWPEKFSILSRIHAKDSWHFHVTYTVWGSSVFVFLYFQQDSEILDLMASVTVSFDSFHLGKLQRDLRKLNILSFSSRTIDRTNHENACLRSGWTYATCSTIYVATSFLFVGTSCFSVEEVMTYS